MKRPDPQWQGWCTTNRNWLGGCSEIPTAPIWRQTLLGVNDRPCDKLSTRPWRRLGAVGGGAEALRRVWATGISILPPERAAPPQGPGPAAACTQPCRCSGPERVQLGPTIWHSRPSPVPPCDWPRGLPFCWRQFTAEYWTSSSYTRTCVVANVRPWLPVWGQVLLRRDAACQRAPHNCHSVSARLEFWRPVCRQFFPAAGLKSH